MCRSMPPTPLQRVDQDIIDLGGYLDITNGATLTVNGNLVLDGGFDADNNAIGGGGSWNGTGTTINTSEAIFCWQSEQCRGES